MAGLQQAAAPPEGLKLGEDFPILCETCLGPNPYLRMIKMPHGRECKISGRPYTAFRWKPGSDARYKETIIAPEVAAAKGVCQTCLMDLAFNVPVAVRDTLLQAGPDASARPQSDVNKEFHWDQERRAFMDGRLEVGGGVGKAASAHDFERLRGIARPNPHYDRNLPKLCSFWVKGECTRVLNRECPFRPCNGTYRFPELNSNHKELAKDLTARLEADGPVAVMKSLDPAVDDIKEKLKEAQKGNRNESIRNRYHGVVSEDQLAQKYLKKGESKAASIEPPADQSITTLWVGALPQGASASSACRRLRCVPPCPRAEQSAAIQSLTSSGWPPASPLPPAGCTREEVGDQFYAYGEIASITILEAKQCAFVEFRTRAAAEEAARALVNALTVRGQRARLQWGKSKQQADGARGGRMPPGIAAPAQPQPWTAEDGPFGKPTFYASMDPNAMGARPDADRR